MVNQPQNLEEIPQGGSHVLDIVFLTSANGTPTNPDGYTPPDDPTGIVTPAWYIYNISAATYSPAPGGYNPPSVADLRYGGSTGRFLITPEAEIDTVLTSDLVGERWAIGWTTTINGLTRTFFEFVTIVESGGASFGETGYATIDSVREDVVDTSITITGASEFTGKVINSIGVAKGLAIRSATGSGGTHTGGGTVGTDTISRSVRSAGLGIGVQSGDSFTLAVRVQVQDNS